LDRAPFRLMGVVNVTPDSFSDGGLFFDAQAAVAHGRELVAEGADVLDVGGESTRPGAEPVGEAEELRRVLPVVEGLASAGAGAGADTQVSIDTSKAAVARAALAAGASVVNDVSALRADPKMAAVVAESGAECCLMHMQGEPRTMQRSPRYGDVVDDVKAFLEERMGFAVREGVAEERVWLDPGIGFGKTLAHNLELLRRLHELTTLGRPLVVGTSRKSFLGRLIADAQGREEPVDVTQRLPGTLATSVMAYERGATVLRVHDVASVRAALAVAAATLGGRWAPTQTTRT
jgi:dihydropteroate synthase